MQFHPLRTRQAGQRAFVSTRALVPRLGSAQQGHDVAEEVEAALRDQLPYATVFTHLGPAEGARSLEDTGLDRHQAGRLGSRRDRYRPRGIGRSAD